MKLSLLVTLLLSLLISACGKQNSKSEAPQAIEPISKDEMQFLMNNQSIWCAEKDQCPEGIGRLIALSSDRYRPSQACSAILISPDLVLTNSHCAYTGRGTLAEACEQLYLAFPNQYGAVQTARCKELVWRDKRQQGSRRYKNGDNDFALIKLDYPLTISPLKMVPHGMKAGSTVYPLVLDQIDGYQARIVKLECTVRGRADRFGVATLDECPIIGGNSGGAVVDENNNVVGVVFASDNIHVRKPTDDLETRRMARNKGYAFTIEHIQKVLGELLNSKDPADVRPASEPTQSSPEGSSDQTVSESVVE